MSNFFTSHPGKGETRRIVGVLISYTWRPEGDLYPVREGKNYIGRDKISSDAYHRNCDVIVPEDDRMSGTHALILCRHGNYELIDQEASNGTFLNGEMLTANTSTKLTNYAEIKTGNTLWTFIKIETSRTTQPKPASKHKKEEPPDQTPPWREDEKSVDTMIGGGYRNATRVDSKDTDKSAPKKEPESPAQRQEVPPESEPVEFAAFTPRSIRLNSQFILDIWAYQRSDYSTVLADAKELKRDIKVGQRAGIPVSPGTVLSIKIEIPSLVVPDPIDMIIWTAKPANVSYIVEVPPDVRPGDHKGKAVISSNGIPIAKLVFLIPVASVEVREYIDSSLHRKLLQSAFASYASEDRDEVFSRIHGMKKIAPDLDIFVDVLSLRSGDNWEKKLEEHVPSKDIFFLFWSQYASKSQWVEKEWRLALGKRGLEYIDPVPLVDPDDTPPPQELSALHFMDAYVGYMKYLSLKNTIEKNH